MRRRPDAWTASPRAPRAAANAVIGTRTLPASYASLFTANGDNTAEDIFRVAFTTSQSNSLGYYWLFAGRHEAEPSANLNAAYEAGDLRKASTVINRPNSSTRLQGVKYPTTLGAEHPHVIRLAELVLLKAEVLGSLGDPMRVIFWTFVRTPEPERDQEPVPALAPRRPGLPRSRSARDG